MKQEICPSPLPQEGKFAGKDVPLSEIWPPPIYLNRHYIAKVFWNKYQNEISGKIESKKRHAGALDILMNDTINQFDLF